MSKGSVSEQLGGGKLFGGVYSGGGSPDTIRSAVEKSELALIIGHYPVRSVSYISCEIRTNPTV